MNLGEVWVVIPPQYSPLSPARYLLSLTFPKVSVIDCVYIAKDLFLQNMSEGFGLDKGLVVA